MCAANDRDVFPPPWFFKINICANHSQYCGRLVGAFLNTANINDIGCPRAFLKR